MVADPLIRMRAADTARRLHGTGPSFSRYKGELLGLMVETQQQELRWHLAAMVPKLQAQQQADGILRLLC